MNDLLIPTMITLRDAAKRTGLSYEYLRQLCLRNRIVHIRTGSKYLINLEKLIEFMNGEKKW